MAFITRYYVYTFFNNYRAKAFFKLKITPQSIPYREARA